MLNFFPVELFYLLKIIHTTHCWEEGWWIADSDCSPNFAASRPR